MIEQLPVLILKGLSVMALACLNFWAGIPAGMTFKFSVLVSALLTAAGSCVGVVLLTLAGAPLQRWFKRKFEKQFEKFKKSRLMGLWERFGVIGFCLLSPGITGAPQAALIAMILGAKPSRVLLWTCLGVGLFTVAVGLAFQIGAERIPFIQKWISG